MLVGVNCTGLVHVVKLEPSMLQSYFLIPNPLPSLPSVSLPTNANVIALNLVLLPLAIELSLPSTALVIVVVGGTLSIFQLNDTGVGLMLPALSSDFTSNIWPPSLRFLSWSGLVQEAKSKLSVLHLNCFIPTPLPSLPPVSIAENANIIESEAVLPPLLTSLL